MFQISHLARLIKSTTDLIEKHVKTKVEEAFAADPLIRALLIFVLCDPKSTVCSLMNLSISLCRAVSAVLDSLTNSGPSGADLEDTNESVASVKLQASNFCLIKIHMMLHYSNAI
jgi:hypothetical protein